MGQLSSYILILLSAYVKGTRRILSQLPASPSDSSSAGTVLGSLL